MRAFLAVEFPDVLKKAYAAVLPRFQERFGSLRWVRPECVHLTLRFLGDIGEGEAAAIEAPVREIAARADPFRFSLGEPGSFGPRSAPRVFFFAGGDGCEPLAGLQPRVEAAVRRLGHSPDDKPWKPHVTVARTRGRGRGSPPEGRGAATAAAWREEAGSSGLSGEGFEVRQLTLLESTLTPRGPVYSPIWKAPLGAD